MKNLFIAALLLFSFAANAQSVKAFGDSNSDYNYDSPPLIEKWLYLVGLENKLVVENFAQAGSTIYSGSGTLAGSGLEARRVRASSGSREWVTIMYGTNDALNFDITDQWKADYKAYIQSIIDYGYERSKVILISPPNYRPDNPEPLKSRLEIIHNYTTAIASELGIRYVDFYQKTKDAVDGRYWNDGIHINTRGHRELANMVNNVMTSNGVLPLKFIAFNVAKIKGENKLKVDFEVAEAEDVKHFNIKYAADGKNFKTIAVVVPDAIVPNKKYSVTVNIPK